MERRALHFTDVRQVSMWVDALPVPEADQVRVRSRMSAISPGTELLIYRGEAPADLPADATIPALAGSLRFPLQYGYSVVGTVDAVGEDVCASWVGRRVFAFHPHESHFVAAPAELVPLPEALADEDAVLLPAMETAVNLVMDGTPLVGERVVVFGQGVVGLMTTSVLARFPLSALVTVEPHALRRGWSCAVGAHACLDPEDASSRTQLRVLLEQEADRGGADLCYELSGDPAVLNTAVEVTGFSGRVVIGSWYGARAAALDLGGRFHRARIRLVSSQVSTVDPRWRGRWDKQRRLGEVLRLLSMLRPGRLVTHRYPLGRAADAYGLLDRAPGETVQVVLTYE